MFEGKTDGLIFFIIRIVLMKIFRFISYFILVLLLFVYSLNIIKLFFIGKREM